MAVKKTQAKPANDPVKSFLGNVGNFLNPKTTPYGQGTHRAAINPVKPANAQTFTPTNYSPAYNAQGGSNTGLSGGIFDQFGRQIGSSSTRQVTNVPQSTPGPGGGVPIPTNNIPGNQGTPGQGTPNQGYQNIQNAQDSGNVDIDNDYNQSMGMLDNAQGGLQGQANSSSAQITNDAAGVTTALGSQQTTGEQGVQKSLSTAEASGKSALQQARDLFRQTQQTNTANLSALGISSSSVSEALAERLGVETARRIAGVTGGLDEVRQNATNELGRIKNYYSEKATQLAENVRIKKDEIQQSLVSGLNQINSARSQAASDKAQARSSLLNQVQTHIYNLTAQQQQFDQQLKTWAQQKSAALTPLTTNVGLQEAFANFSNLTNSSSFDTTKYSADMNIGKGGTPTYGFSTITPRKPVNPNDPAQATQPTGQITSNNSIPKANWIKYPNDGYQY